MKIYVSFYTNTKKNLLHYINEKNLLSEETLKELKEKFKISENLKDISVIKFFNIISSQQINQLEENLKKPTDEKAKDKIRKEIEKIKSILGLFESIASNKEVPLQLLSSVFADKDAPQLTEDEVKQIDSLWAASIVEIAKLAKDQNSADAFDKEIEKILQNSTIDDAKKIRISNAYKECKECLKTLDIKELNLLEKNSKYFQIGGFVVAATTLIFAIAEVQARTQVFGQNNVIATMFGALKSFTEKLGSSISLGKDLSRLGFMGILAGASVSLLTAWYFGSKTGEPKKEALDQAKRVFDANLAFKTHMPGKK